MAEMTLDEMYRQKSMVPNAVNNFTISSADSVRSFGTPLSSRVNQMNTERQVMLDDIYDRSNQYRISQELIEDSRTRRSLAEKQLEENQRINTAKIKHEDALTKSINVRNQIEEDMALPNLREKELLNKNLALQNEATAENQSMDKMKNVVEKTKLSNEDAWLKSEEYHKMFTDQKELKQSTINAAKVASAAMEKIVQSVGETAVDQTLLKQEGTELSFSQARKDLMRKKQWLETQEGREKLKLSIGQKKAERVLDLMADVAKREEWDSKHWFMSTLRNVGVELAQVFTPKVLEKLYVSISNDPGFNDPMRRDETILKHMKLNNLNVDMDFVKSNFPTRYDDSDLYQKVNTNDTSVADFTNIFNSLSASMENINE